MVAADIDDFDDFNPLENQWSFMSLKPLYENLLVIYPVGNHLTCEISKKLGQGLRVKVILRGLPVTGRCCWCHGVTHVGSPWCWLARLEISLKTVVILADLACCMFRYFQVTAKRNKEETTQMHRCFPQKHHTSHQSSLKRFFYEPNRHRIGSVDGKFFSMAGDSFAPEGGQEIWWWWFLIVLCGAVTSVFFLHHLVVDICLCLSCCFFQFVQAKIPGLHLLFLKFPGFIQAFQFWSPNQNQ